MRERTRDRAQAPKALTRLLSLRLHRPLSLLRSLLPPVLPSDPAYPILMRRWFVFNLALAALVVLLYLSPILSLLTSLLHLLRLR